MKKHLLKYFLFLFPAVFAFQVCAQNKRYISSMQKKIVLIDTVRAIKPLQELANAFKYITEKEKEEWLPPYYTAYCYAAMAQLSKGDRIDIFCDTAELFINKADKLKPDNSEIYVIMAKIAAARISVNTIKRGLKYGQAFNSLIEKSRKLDPLNPRPWLLEGQQKFYTPVQLGGGKQNAKAAFQKALELYQTFKPASSIHPDWGEKTAQYFLKKCNEK